jgi:mannose-6-phosphate isomerase class I
VTAFPISPEPFRIEPVFSERLWGSRSLAPLFPEMRDLDPLIGEAWLTGVDCLIANGPFGKKCPSDGVAQNLSVKLTSLSS